MDELNKALAEARLKGRKGLNEIPKETKDTLATGTQLKGKIEITQKGVSELDDDSKSQAVVKKASHSWTQTQHKGLRKWKTPASCKRDCVKVPKKVKA